MSDSQLSSTRSWLSATSVALAVASILITVCCHAGKPSDVIDIGSRRELFVDDLLVGEMKGTDFQLHRPQLLPKTPRPFGHYATVMKDGDIFRLYYRGDKIPGAHWRNGWAEYHLGEVTLLAESDDGFIWREPNLGLYEIETFPNGNVVMADDFLVTHNFTPMIDTRPGCPAEERFKAVGGLTYPPPTFGGWKTPTHRDEVRRQYGVGGLYAYVSADAIHWRRWQQEPIIPEELGKFDSQNVAFWSEAEQQYVCYYRWMKNGLRSIRRTTSKDFRTWTEPINMQANQPDEHLYTSGTHPYFRAPHLYIAPATRFMANRSSITDVVLMTTRPGSDHYDRRFKEAWIRPGLGESGWGNRQNYLAWQAVPTSSTHMSLYMYGGGHYRLRHDGFISVHAGFEPGELVTRPLRFTGDRLDVNFSTSAAGEVRIEIQTPDGTPVDGYTLDDFDRLYGDEIDRTATWNKSVDLSELAGKPIRLRFVMTEADLYSLKFSDSQ